VRGLRVGARLLGSLALFLCLLGLMATDAQGSPTSSHVRAAAAHQASATAGSPIPVLAYYYIWFDPSSWDRAKQDLPLLGRYSSDERAVMRQHIELARAAGISGFLVSWKDTPKLTERLRRLVEIARAENFKLGIVYQGLDFARQPIPVLTVAADLRLLADTYANDPVFHIVDTRPVVIWTGTDSFSEADLRSAVAPVRDRLKMMASSRSVDQWKRVSSIFEGNAYYWSSVNPSKSWYPRQLAEMGRAVHDSGDLWIAPAAAGFDARLVGGKAVVPRDGGRTLAKELQVATQSSGDVIGLISWNEFTENSHVEPSQKYGRTALQTVADFTGSTMPLPVLDSGTPGPGVDGGGLNGLAAITVMLGVLGALLTWTRWKRAPDSDPVDEVHEISGHPS
jgi:hypothetical protein